MLIRFVVNNIYSFGESKEFNMIPSPRYTRLSNHKYNINDFSILKLSSIYGANGAGKSNLVKALSILQDIIIEEELPIRISDKVFKFYDSKSDSSQILAVEFFQSNRAFHYALEIKSGIILTEELYESGLGKKDDKIIFERKTNNTGKSEITFSKNFENDKESRVLKNVIEKSLTKPNKPIFKFLTTLDNPFLSDVKIALEWFDETLQIIMPNAKPRALAQKIDLDTDFKKYAEDIMCSFHIGIESIKTEKKGIIEFFGNDNANELDELIKNLEESPRKMVGLQSRNGDEIIVVREDEGIFVKQLKLEHTGRDGIKALFNLDEESDGTIRLLDFIPAFKDVVSKKRVFVIDEMERSIHPLLIKELIRKFSEDDNTNGQLIFSTHESNLLDQNIFRQDEIWFAEKDKNGSTDIYSLSDFKEHNTIDIRKGYLNGRYGSIPFLANLQDLNWHNYDTKE